jgi:hypothetical protein
VLLAVPGALVLGLKAFGRDGRPWVRTWPTRFAGAFVVLAGVFMVLAL